MAELVIRRVIESIVVLFIVSLISFFVMHVLPGDPAGSILGETASPQALAEVKHELGLDEPLYQQYFSWLGNVFEGNFGVRYGNGLSVRTQLVHRLGPTVELGVLSLLLALAVALILGTVAAAHRGGPIDAVARLIGVAGIAVPGFWLGMVLIVVCSVKLGWLPAFGYVPITEHPLSNLEHMVMPVVSLSLIQVAVLVRFVRGSMVEVLEEDYVRTARAKGLSSRLVLGRHALRNALIPVMTLVGLQIGRILGGAAVIETLFSIPGVGHLTVDAVLKHDYNVVQAVMLLTGVAMVSSNLMVDIAYGWLDPRIRARMG
jgi:peptide/nickel transport system permease protein